MARSLRIEYSGAWYHVMNRGRRGERVFRQREDYQRFIELLKDICRLWQARVGAYCLMSNHYHLVIQTPGANLSRCMRHVNGVYTQYYNRRYASDGQLFRGRCKSILIDADSYLLQLVRYIHNNPLRAGMVKRPDEYVWTSHRGYLSKARQWKWLHKDFVLSLLSEEKSKQRSAYLQYIRQKEPSEIKEIYSRVKLPWILGTDRFVERIKKKYFVSDPSTAPSAFNPAMT